MSTSIMVQERQRRCLVAAAMALVVPSVAIAELTAHIDRAGRLVGAGWGDGYHACESSGIRPGADLPPRSYGQRNTGLRSRHRVDALHRVASTFYDRFDAARGHQRDCCDEGACDAPEILIDGSQMIQSAPAAPVPAPTLAPIPLSQSPPAAPPELPAPPASLETPNASVAMVPRRPDAATLKPQPDSAAVTPDVPVAMRNSTAASRLRESPRVADADQVPRLSGTPRGIVPSHPGYRTPSRTERLLQAALGDDFKMPPLPPRAPSIAQSSGAANRPPDPPTERSDALNLGANLADPPSVPSFLPPIESTGVRTDGPANDGGGRSERPRDGYTSTPQSKPIVLRVYPNIRTNPHALPRATLELAKRPPSADAEFIRQPR